MKSVSWSNELTHVKTIPKKPIKYVVEYSKSAKSVCQQCKTNILDEELRVAKMTATPKYFHVKCVPAGVYAQDLDGIEKLKKIDQRIVDAALKE